MEENYVPISVTCPTGHYKPQDYGEHRQHDIDWDLTVKVNGDKPLENMTTAEIMALLSTQVEQATADALVGMTHSAYEMAPNGCDVAPSVAFNYKVDSRRNTQWESQRQPFLTEFDFKGKLSVDTKTPVSEDQAWLLAKPELALHLAQEVTNTILENVDNKA